MITNSEEYLDFLTKIENGTPTYELRIPSDEPIYEVDLNTRVINAPKFLSVETDHDAELIYFSIDRYFENIDLLTCAGLVLFKNAKNEEYAYLIPAYDVVTKPGKIIFGWNIQGAVTKYSGNVQFAFKFFKLNEKFDEESNSFKPVLEFDLNTLIAQSKILSGWASISKSDPSDLYVPEIIIDNDILEGIADLKVAASELRELQQEMQIFWLDV